MKVNEAMAQLSDVIHLHFFRQRRCRIHIKKLTKGVIGRKRHDNCEETSAAGDDTIGLEDVRMRKSIDQIKFRLEIVYNSLHLFQRALDQDFLHGSGVAGIGGFVL